MIAQTNKEKIEAKLYADNRILEWYNREIESTKVYIDGGKFKDGWPYNGRPFRSFELRDLNVLLNDLKKGKKRVIKFITKLQKDIKGMKK